MQYAKALHKWDILNELLINVMNTDEDKGLGTYRASSGNCQILQLVFPVVPESWSLDCNDLKSNLQPVGEF